MERMSLNKNNIITHITSTIGSIVSYICKSINIRLCNEYGFGLVETIIVIIVMIIVGATGLTQVPKVFKAVKAKQVTDDLEAISSQENLMQATSTSLTYGVNITGSGVKNLNVQFPPSSFTEVVSKSHITADGKMYLEFNNNTVKVVGHADTFSGTENAKWHLNSKPTQAYVQGTSSDTAILEYLTHFGEAGIPPLLPAGEEAIEAAYWNNVLGFNDFTLLDEDINGVFNNATDLQSFKDNRRGYLSRLFGDVTEYNPFLHDVDRAVKLIRIDAGSFLDNDIMIGKGINPDNGCIYKVSAICSENEFRNLMCLDSAPTSASGTPATYAGTKVLDTSNANVENTVHEMYKALRTSIQVGTIIWIPNKSSDLAVNPNTNYNTPIVKLN